MFTKHHPGGGGAMHCDSAQIERLICEYQTNRDTETLGAILALTQKRAETPIRFYQTTKYRPEEELLSDINWKLVKVIDSFNPHRGSAFTFVSSVIWSTLSTAVMNARRDSAHKLLLDEKLTQKLAAPNTETSHMLEDLRDRIKTGVRSTLSDPTELEVQRWLVDSFCDEGFEHRRHECSDAAMTVFGGHPATVRAAARTVALTTANDVFLDTVQPGTKIFGSVSITSWIQEHVFRSLSPGSCGDQPRCSTIGESE